MIKPSSPISRHIAHGQPPDRDMPDRCPTADLPYGPQGAHSPDAPRIVHGIGNVLLIIGLCAGGMGIVLMCYLNRGEYHPMDVLALLAMSVAWLACRRCLAAGVLSHLIAVVLRAVLAWRQTRAPDRRDTEM